MASPAHSVSNDASIQGHPSISSQVSRPIERNLTGIFEDAFAFVPTPDEAQELQRAMAEEQREALSLRTGQAHKAFAEDNIEGLKTLLASHPIRDIARKSIIKAAYEKGKEAFILPLLLNWCIYLENQPKVPYPVPEETRALFIRDLIHSSSSTLAGQAAFEKMIMQDLPPGIKMAVRKVGKDD